jgi:hypothetical protein
MYRENTHQARQPDSPIITADTPIKKAAAEYLAAGFALTNVDGKRPTVKGWNERCNAITSADQLSGLAGNIGLLHAYSGTCCIDVDDLRGALDYFQASGLDLMQLLTADDAVKIDSGRPNRAKLPYRTAETLPTFKHVEDGKAVVEFRCADAGGGSVMDVLPPSIHPDTGKPYKWIGNWRKLPFLPPALADFWKTKAAFVTSKDSNNHRGNISSVVIPISSKVIPDCKALKYITSNAEQKKLFQDEAIQRHLLQFLGFKDFESVFKTGRAVVYSVVREDKNKSGGLMRGDDGFIWFNDFSGAIGGTHITLQYVYALQLSGDFKRFRGLLPTKKGDWSINNVTAGVLGGRLLVDAGLVKPAKVKLPPCPGTDKNLVQLYSGIKRLFEVRWAFLPTAGAPVPLGREFIGPWSGMGAQQVREPIKELISNGVIYHADNHGRMRLYAPGTKPPQKPKGRTKK